MEPEIVRTLARIADVLERLEAKLDGQQAETLTTEEACELLKIHRSTLERRMAEWQEGSHYWREGNRLRFDRPLLEDWARNRDNPAAHQRAIEIRRKQLLSNQKKR